MAAEIRAVSVCPCCIAAAAFIAQTRWVAFATLARDQASRAPCLPFMASRLRHRAHEWRLDGHRCLRAKIVPATARGAGISAIGSGKVLARSQNEKQAKKDRPCRSQRPLH